jgi:peptide/nickel transport system ATP-binding protein
VRCHHWQQLTLPPAQHQQREERQHNHLLLQVEDLSISYARRGFGAWVARQLGQSPTPAAVRSVGFGVMHGQTLALVGESGSGKSTIARTIAGLRPAIHGRILFDQQPVAANAQQRPIEVRRRIQLIFQNPDAALNPRQTIEQILWRPQQLFFGRNRRDAHQRSAQLLEQMRIPVSYLDHLPSQLSGGEKQRVAIARAFLAEPDLILCDEVVSALDVSVQAAVLALLADLQTQRQVSYLFISHDLAVVRALADQVAVLYQGQLCEIGPASALFAPPYHPYTESLLAAVPQPDPAQRYQALDRDPLLPAVAAAASPACPFYHRCPRRIESLCAHEEPPWQQTSQGHSLRCHWPLAELTIPLVSSQRPTPTPASARLVR